MQQDAPTSKTVEPKMIEFEPLPKKVGPDSLGHLPEVNEDAYKISFQGMHQAAKDFTK